MTSADDPRKAWQYMIEQLQKAWPGPNAPEFLQTMFSPMQQQVDLLRKALEAQAEFHRKLTEQMFARCVRWWTACSKPSRRRALLVRLSSRPETCCYSKQLQWIKP